jgi:phosphatidylglycerophosphatase A
MLLTFFGAGKSPRAPGTVGSLGASIIIAVLYPAIFEHVTFLSWNLILLFGSFAACVGLVALGPWAMVHYGTKDPQPVVLDEVAGVFLTMVFVPMDSDWHGWLMIAIGFIAFRAFDITKPPPCRQLERLPAGWGILCDDLMAGVYANFVCQVAARFI